MERLEKNSIYAVYAVTVCRDSIYAVLILYLSFLFKMPITFTEVCLG